MCSIHTRNLCRRSIMDLRKSKPIEVKNYPSQQAQGYSDPTQEINSQSISAVELLGNINGINLRLVEGATTLLPVRFETHIAYLFSKTCRRADFGRKE